MAERNSNICFVLVFVVTLLTVNGVSAEQHVVGGSQGWTESTDYDTWASGQTFKVGDQLVFKYSPLHTVVELSSESAYKSCDIGSATDSLTGGNNVVKLTKAGTRYFACGTMGHCDQGMKVKITSVSSSSSPTPASPSSSSSSPSTPTTTTSRPTSSAVAWAPVLSSFIVFVTFFMLTMA